MNRKTPAFAAVLACVLSGCTSPEKALHFADQNAVDAISRKQACVTGKTEPYSVDVPKDRIRDETVDPATGLASRPTPIAIDLSGALAIATKNSRDYQTRKENLYRVALRLVNERIKFTPSPFLTMSATATGEDGVHSIGAGTELGITQMLTRGGTVILSAGGDFLRFVTNPTSKTASSFLNLVVTLPLLRGSGEDVVLENLRQADRDVIYAVRDLERFKQTFSVQVETQYLRVLASGRRVINEERNLESLTIARQRNEAFGQAQRITEIEVDQARQDELRAKNRVVIARNSFQAALDGLKNTLGIPVDLQISVDDHALEALTKLLDREVNIPETQAMERGLQLRLDLQNVHDHIADAKRRIFVAEDRLRPDLDLGLAARPDSENLKPFKVRFLDGRYTAGVDADAGLDRRTESISLREAHLDLALAIRDFEGISETVKSEIREDLRDVSVARESYRIQDRAVAVAKRRVESVNEFILRGDATTRDLLEAQEALVTAENDLVTALVEFRVTFLNFYRDAGALVVSPEGLDNETSDALLATS